MERQFVIITLSVGKLLILYASWPLGNLSKFSRILILTGKLARYFLSRLLLVWREKLVKCMHQVAEL